MLKFYILIAVIIATLLIASFISKKQRAVVQETSIMLKKLMELNAQFIFDWSIQSQYTFEILLQSKSQFDRYDLINLFDDSILKNIDELTRAAKVIEHNKTLYSRYFQELNCLKSETTQEQLRLFHIPHEKYVRIEEELFSEQQIRPILASDIICTASYCSPKGRNHYSKKAIYSIDEVPKRYAKLQQKKAYQNSEEARRKRARSQMTDKLRYSILKRDGFRCKICGRTAADGVKLHIDHIIPVSKGGESTPDNLRTLCETCNLGKGDEIE